MKNHRTNRINLDLLMRSVDVSIIHLFISTIFLNEAALGTNASMLLLLYNSFLVCTTQPLESLIGLLTKKSINKHNETLVVVCE